ncbi:MAG: magnesium transporter CorA family protein [Ignavibacteriales bacterium]|nr:magnesium transporter CorA family protein [Ignavibacteriales bacterium]
MIKQYSILNNSLVETTDQPGSVIVSINPDQQERASLCSMYHIDEHTLASALDPDEVSRIELSDTTTSLIWKRALNCSAKDNFYFNVGSFGIFLTGDNLVVVAEEELTLLGSGSRHNIKFTTPLELLLAIILGTIQHYLGHLKVIKMIAHDLQRRINTSMANEHLIQMFNLSESLVYYTNAISANGIVLGRLRTLADKLNYEPRIIEIIDDIVIENNQCLRQAEIYSTVFSGLMDARGSLVNNNMSMLLKNLTIINIVFLPLNLIAGIGGMSEFSMMTHGIDWRISYAVFFAAMVVLGWITAYVLGKVNFTSMNPFEIFRLKRKKFH